MGIVPSPASSILKRGLSSSCVRRLRSRSRPRNDKQPSKQYLAPLVCDSPKSVMSVGKLSAWNKVSMTSLWGCEDDQSGKLLRIHSPRKHAESVYSFDSREELSVASDDGQSTASAAQAGAENPCPSLTKCAFLPTMRAIPSQLAEPFPAEPFPDFLDRILQTQACCLDERRLSEEELESTSLSPSLLSPLSPVGYQNTYEGENKYTEWEWSALEHEILDLASTLKGYEGAHATVSRRFCDAVSVSREDIRLVSLSGPVPDDILAPEDNLTADQVEDILEHTLAESPTNSPTHDPQSIPAEEVHHDHSPTLPYQAFTGTFDPFPSLAPETLAATKRERRNFSLIGQADWELNLPPSPPAQDQPLAEFHRTRSRSPASGHRPMASLETLLYDDDAELSPAPLRLSAASSSRAMRDSVLDPLPPPLDLQLCSLRRQASLCSEKRPPIPPRSNLRPTVLVPNFSYPRLQLVTDRKPLLRRARGLRSFAPVRQLTPITEVSSRPGTAGTMGRVWSAGGRGRRGVLRKRFRGGKGFWWKFGLGEGAR